ncbi:methionyl-tRNA formyltransferase-like isoform X1 [Tanacetum coccineum]
MKRIFNPATEVHRNPTAITQYLSTNWKMQHLSLSLILRRFCCLATPPSYSSVLSSSNKKKKLVFLGSPSVSASVLEKLLDASSASHPSFQVAGIVTQPPSARDRGRKVMPSHVAQLALDRGFPADLIFTPVKASEEAFLSDFSALEPELCITAAYGNILPTKFLKIPSLGTVNIHPSLLPLYRGAAPVQRALQDGVKETGVSLAFTVRALDAGAVIACEKMQVDDHIKAPELLDLLFARGSELLLQELPSIFDGSARTKAQEQDDSKATLAPKINQEESWLSFDQEAVVLHNKVRAFAGWPGTRAKILVIDEKSDKRNELDLKVITSRVYHGDVQSSDDDEVTYRKGSLIVPCGGRTALEVLNYAKDFLNNLGTPATRQESSKCSCILERSERSEAKNAEVVEEMTLKLKKRSGLFSLKIYQCFVEFSNTDDKRKNVKGLVAYLIGGESIAKVYQEQYVIMVYVSTLRLKLTLIASPPTYKSTDCKLRNASSTPVA